MFSSFNGLILKISYHAQSKILLANTSLEKNGLLILIIYKNRFQVAEHIIQYLKQIEDIATNPHLQYTVCLIKPSCCLWHLADTEGTWNQVEDAKIQDVDLSNTLIFRIRKLLTESFQSRSSNDSSFDGLDIMSSFSNGKSAFLLDEIRTVLYDNEDGQIIGNISCADIVNEIRKSRDLKVWPEPSKPLENVIDVSSLVRMSFDVPEKGLDSSDESVDNVEAGCSVPVLLSKRVTGESVTVKVDIDCLVLVPADTPAPKLLFMFRDAIYRQSIALQLLLRKHHKVLQPFHFVPSQSHVYPVTAFVPCYDRKGVTIDDNSTALDYRRSLHKRFGVVDDRPVFKKCLSMFSQRKLSDYHLINPHQGLNVPAIDGGKVAMVDGRYAYHHYMQEGFDDGHWGCAYRSLQTLSSWFWLQGYTDARYPTHEDIQKVLVKIGDKEEDFVGSREWIGSMEVSYCLDELFGVTSKTLHVSTGADLAYKGRELYQHFLTQGTPVMIGGGVYAHTIVGVVYNEDTGDIRFLIVDPHFTGSDNLKTVQSKGWVGWKGPNFWNQTAHYNMCMPQRPNII